MAKKLKTGDVVRLNSDCVNMFKSDKWLTIYPHTFVPTGWPTRARARLERIDWWPGHRIARILSIGPKYIKVRISK